MAPECPSRQRATSIGVNSRWLRALHWTLTKGSIQARSVAVRPTGQLSLPIFPGPRFAEADFRQAPSNANACAWLRRTDDWPNHRLALWGEPGRGKTHLLQIWAARTGAEVWTAASLSDLPDLPTAGVALDDADAVRNETALLHLLNAAGEARLPILLAARAPPSRWAVRLPDLASRLRAITAVELGPPEDALLRALLARLLADRLLRPPEALQEWLVRRLPRSAAALREAVARLDAAALDRHRNITVPFAAEVLVDLLAPDEISGTPVPPSRDGPALL
jgi:chromosomal replication initiation ATPase DnaA